MARVKSSMTLSDCYSKLLSTRWANMSQFASQKNMCDIHLTLFGKTRLMGTMSIKDVDKLKEYVKMKGYKPSTANKHLSAFSCALDYAIERGALTSKPAIGYFKTKQGRIRFITDDEEKRIFRVLSHLGEGDFLDYILVLLDTGMRRNELLFLKGVDYDEDHNLIHIWKNKSDRPRTVHCTNRVRGIMDKRKALHRSGRLFPTLSMGGVQRKWERMRSIMGLSGDTEFVIHALRHTCASRLVQSGVSLLVVKEWLGHSDIQMTMKYSHLCPDNFRAAAEVLNKRNTV